MSARLNKPALGDAKAARGLWAQRLAASKSMSTLFGAFLSGMTAFTPSDRLKSFAKPAGWDDQYKAFCTA